MKIAYEKKTLQWTNSNGNVLVDGWNVLVVGLVCNSSEMWWAI